MLRPRGAGRAGTRLAPVFLLLFLLTQACGARPTAQVTPTGETSPAPLVSPTAPAPSPTLPSLSPTAIATPTLPLAPTFTIAPVTITAVNGDLAIRSGPDPVFDAIDVLKNGQSAQVLARSVLDGWVQIPIPGQPGQTGWISMKTSYSIVEGDVLDLPEIMTVEWPFGSYMRNCTPHQLLVEPGAVEIPSVSASPNNRLWFAPGLFNVYDASMPGQPFVLQVKLVSHTQFDIQIDGSRQRSICP